MDLREILKRRRMVRHYTGEAVPRETLERIVATVRRAPSAGFSQGQRLLVVDDAGLLADLAALAGPLEPDVEPGHLDAYFRDATTGHESYEVGRYVSVERVGDEVVLDFNRAYNPSCALSPFYNCPIPPRENHLRIAIRAGEMTPLDTHARR